MSDSILYSSIEAVARARRELTPQEFDIAVELAEKNDLNIMTVANELKAVRKPQRLTGDELRSVLQNTGDGQ